MTASALAIVPSRPAPASRGLADITVHDALSEVRADWDALLTVAPASAYQTPGWLSAWLATVGRGVRPAFIMGRDAQGPTALLPLGLQRMGGVTVARFLGGRDANFGLGLFHPDATWGTATLHRFLAEAARKAKIDVVCLGHQPQAFGGFANPLAALAQQPSPSDQHEAVLSRPAEAFLERTLSKRTRKHIRQKENKLSELGPVCHEMGTDAAAAERIASALLAQRAARFGPRGCGPDDKAFLLAGSRTEGAGRAALELHALSCSGNIVAAFAGAAHAGRLSGMLLSFSPDPGWARFSPGELLVARVVAAACRDGVTAFDLGVGEARYKESFCPVTVPLFDTALGFTPKGRLAARAWLTLRGIKRRAKRSPRLGAWAARLRRGA